MCDVATAVSAAVGLGANMAGSYQQSRAANKQAKARSQALQADEAKQRAFQEQASQQTQKTTGNFSAENQEAMRQQNIQNAVENQTGVGQTGDYTTKSDSAPVEVKSEIARKIADAVSAGRGYAGSAANLNSYGQTNFDNALALTAGGENIDRINNFSRGQSSTLPSALNAASMKGQNNLLMADIFNGVSGIASAYAIPKVADFAGDYINTAFKSATSGAVPDMYSLAKAKPVANNGVGIKLSI